LVKAQVRRNAKKANSIVTGWLGFQFLAILAGWTGLCGFKADVDIGAAVELSVAE
jgi:hypothetical protein